jgi:hypothetical protein
MVQGFCYASTTTTQPHLSANPSQIVLDNFLKKLELISKLPKQQQVKYENDIALIRVCALTGINTSTETDISLLPAIIKILQHPLIYVNNATFNIAINNLKILYNLYTNNISDETKKLFIQTVKFLPSFKQNGHLELNETAFDVAMQIFQYLEKLYTHFNTIYKHAKMVSNGSIHAQPASERSQIAYKNLETFCELYQLLEELSESYLSPEQRTYMKSEMCKDLDIYATGYLAHTLGNPTKKTIKRVKNLVTNVLTKHKNKQSLSDFSSTELFLKFYTAYYSLNNSENSESSIKTILMITPIILTLSSYQQHYFMIYETLIKATAYNTQEINNLKNIVHTALLKKTNDKLSKDVAMHMNVGYTIAQAQELYKQYTVQQDDDCLVQMLHLLHEIEDIPHRPEQKKANLILKIHAHSHLLSPQHLQKAEEYLAQLKLLSPEEKTQDSLQDMIEYQKALLLLKEKDKKSAQKIFERVSQKGHPQAAAYFIFCTDLPYCKDENSRLLNITEKLLINSQITESPLFELLKLKHTDLLQNHHTLILKSLECSLEEIISSLRYFETRNRTQYEQAIFEKGYLHVAQNYLTQGNYKKIIEDQLYTKVSEEQKKPLLVATSKLITEKIKKYLSLINQTEVLQTKISKSNQLLDPLQNLQTLINDMSEGSDKQELMALAHSGHQTIKTLEQEFKRQKRHARRTQHNKKKAKNSIHQEPKTSNSINDSCEDNTETPKELMPASEAQDNQIEQLQNNNDANIFEIDAYNNQQETTHITNPVLALSIKNMDPQNESSSITQSDQEKNLEVQHLKKEHKNKFFAKGHSLANTIISKLHFHAPEDLLQLTKKCFVILTNPYSTPSYLENSIREICKTYNITNIKSKNWNKTISGIYTRLYEYLSQSTHINTYPELKHDFETYINKKLKPVKTTAPKPILLICEESSSESEDDEENTNETPPYISPFTVEEQNKVIKQQQEDCKLIDDFIAHESQKWQEYLSGTDTSLTHHSKI